MGNNKFFRPRVRTILKYSLFLKKESFESLFPSKKFFKDLADSHRKNAFPYVFVIDLAKSQIRGPGHFQVIRVHNIFYPLYAISMRYNISYPISAASSFLFF